MPESDRRDFLKVILGAATAGIIIPTEVFAAEESQLEKDVEKHVKQTRSWGKVYPDARTAWTVYDLSSDEKLVSINEDVPMQAASMIKDFVALAVLHQVSKGKIKYSPRVAKEIKYSMWKSDNCSTNWLIESVGGPESVERLLKENYPEIVKEVSITDYIPLTNKNIAQAKARGIRTKDVPRGRSYYSNLASAQDYCRLLNALWHNKLPYSIVLKKAMALESPDRICDKAESVPNNTLVFNKTGTTGRCIADHGILVPKDKKGRRRPYIIVGIIDTPTKKNLSDFSRLGGELIGGVSSLVYKHLDQKYDLR